MNKAGSVARTNCINTVEKHVIQYSKGNWTKILVGRHPFERLYSAWNDKSRSFRFPNGTYDLSTAAKETTYLWGRSNLTKIEQGQSSKEFGVDIDDIF